MEEETIEEMVWRMERELDKELSYLLTAPSPTAAQPYADPVQRMLSD